MKSVCVYCSSSDQLPPEYLAAAREMGAAIAGRGLQIVYGAGSTGLMGALADGALQAGGRVVGVIPALFNTPKLAHNGLTRLEVVETIHVRKARMIELADAFIALPGGYGTLEELFEVLTWAQIGLHAKPVGLLNTHGYYDALLEQVERARREGFIYQEHRSLFTCAGDPGELLDALANFKRPTGLERWLSRDDPESA
jgi:uncharacterized protein (TIGR00730 family)